MATKSDILTMLRAPAMTEWLDGTAGYLDAATLGVGDPPGEFTRPTAANGLPFVDDATGGTIYWTADWRLAVSHAMLSPTLAGKAVRVTLPSAPDPTPPAAPASANPVPQSAPAVPPGTTTTHTVTVGDQTVPVTATHTETVVQASAPIPTSLRAKLGHVVVVIGTDLEHALAQIRAFFETHVLGHKAAE